MKKHMIFILTIMLAICLGGCSFSLGKNNENTPVDNASNTNETNVNMQFYDAAQKIIVNDLYKVMSIRFCGENNHVFSFGDKTKITIDDLNDYEKYAIVYNNLVKNYDSMSVDSALGGFSKSAFAKSYKEIFGIEPNLPDVIDITSIFGKYTINENDYYSHTLIVGGCAGSVATHNYLLDTYEVKNEYLSFTVIDYVEDNRYIDESKYYIVNNLLDDNFSFEKTEGMTTEEIETKVKENKDKFTQYRFNFKLSEDHYVFDSIEKIN